MGKIITNSNTGTCSIKNSQSFTKASVRNTCYDNNETLQSPHENARNTSRSTASQGANELIHP